MHVVSRIINKIIVKYKFLIPRIEKMLDILKSSVVFSKLDLIMVPKKDYTLRMCVDRQGIKNNNSRLQVSNTTDWKYARKTRNFNGFLQAWPKKWLPSFWHKPRGWVEDYL